MIKFIGTPTINKGGDAIEEYKIRETQELSYLVQGIVNNLAGTKWKRSTDEIKIFLL